MTDTPERMTPEAWECFCEEGYFHMWCVRPVGSRAFGEGFHVGQRAEAERLRDHLAALAQRVERAEDQVAFQRDVIESCRAHKAELLARTEAAEARADALEKEAGRLREFVRRCSYAHLFPVDGLKLSSEAKAALSEPSDDTPTPSEADDHGR